jgi:hypothetical protein
MSSPPARSTEPPSAGAVAPVYALPESGGSGSSPDPPCAPADVASPDAESPPAPALFEKMLMTSTPPRDLTEPPLAGAVEPVYELSLRRTSEL